MRLQLATWPDVEDYLSRRQAIVIPTGSTEQHGRTGPIGTDTLCAEQIALAAEDSDMLVGPTLGVTPAQFNLAFPGTISLRASTFAAVITDYVTSLARSGFTEFYFLNGHGANIPALKAALHDVHWAASISNTADQSVLRFRIRSWWEFPETNQLRSSLYANREGMHATPSELSIAAHVLGSEASARVDGDFERLDDDFYANHAQDFHDGAETHRRHFGDGHVGSDPRLASADDGASLLMSAARELRHDWEDFATGGPA